MRRKWVDANERSVWFARFEYASRALINELKKIGLKQLAKEVRPTRPKRPVKARVI